MSLFLYSDLQEEGDDDIMFKMVFVVNMDLAMGVGKVSPVVTIWSVGILKKKTTKHYVG